MPARPLRSPVQLRWPAHGPTRSALSGRSRLTAHFDVDPNNDGKREIWGTYTVAGDTITIQETGRTTPIPKDCKGPGVYKFSRPDASTLMFTLVNDACALRKKNVLLAQHKK